MTKKNPKYGLVLNVTGFVLDMIGLVLKVTEINVPKIDSNKTGFVFLQNN